MQCYQCKSKGQSWQSCSVEMKIFPFRLAWENSQHFTMPPKVSSWNDIWETSTEIPYWWCITTQIWVVLLILPAVWPIRSTTKILAVTRHQYGTSAFVSQTSFRVWQREESLGADFRKSRGEGRHTASPFFRDGMDIFWNHTILWSAAAVWYQ